MTDAMPLMKGTLDVLVLKALTWGPTHGFGITCWIEERSEGGIAVDDGALYQALYRLEARGLIRAEWGTSDNNRRARYYSMTAAGRAHLRKETQALLRYARTMAGLLERRTV